MSLKFGLNREQRIPTQMGAPMQRTYVPGAGLSDWRTRLADPEKHWKRGASAFEAAVSWELATKTSRGLPPPIHSLLDQEPDLAGASLLFAFPEHQVSLPGGSRPSQTDVWTVLKGPRGLISMAVEAKADETFGEPLAAWLRADSMGKRERLAYLTEVLNCKHELADTIRYQLLHRTASAIIEARRIGADIAIMLVQSFRPSSPSEADYISFGVALGAAPAIGKLVRVPGHMDPALYLGWATSPLSSDADIAACSS